MLKILFTILIVLAIAFIVLLFQQARSSARQSAPQLINARFPPCPDKPNCVSSMADASDSTHYLPPLAVTTASMDDLADAVQKDGGTATVIDGNLLTATYKSSLFGFIDDLMLLKTPEHVEVRSSSRVGYSDLDANRKRVERLRAALESSNRSIE